MPGIDETEESYRVRQVDTGKFKEGSFRTIDITDGVKAVIGRPHGEETTKTQTYIFSKDKFKSKDQVKAWLKKEGKKVMKATLAKAIDIFGIKV